VSQDLLQYLVLDMSLYQRDSSDVYSLPVPPGIKLEAGCANMWIPSPLPTSDSHLDIHVVSLHRRHSTVAVVLSRCVQWFGLFAVCTTGMWLVS